MSWSPSRILFAIASTVVLFGVLTFLQLSFEGADVKTAINLVETANIGEASLGHRMERFIPVRWRYCSASVLDRFQGHMEVICRHTQIENRVFRWHVNLADGMVKPVNEASRRLGIGLDPWEEK